MAEKAPVTNEQIGKIASELDQAQWNRRKKMWNRMLGWGLGGVVAGVGLLALSALTLGAAPAFAAGTLLTADIVANLGGASMLIGLGGRLFDRRPKS